MVIKKVFSAIAGKRNRRSAASLTVTPVKSNGSPSVTNVVASRCILGALPNNTSIGISIGVSSNNESVTVKCNSSVATPTTENGVRSRLQIASNVARFSGATAMT